MNNRLAKKIDIHKGSGERNNDENRIGNNYLGCEYQYDGDERE